MKVVLAQLNPIVGDLQGNAKRIIATLKKSKDADLIVFPELALCGYPPEDLLLLSHFMEGVEKTLEVILSHAAGLNVVIGLPRTADLEGEKGLHNSAAIISNGELLGFQDKMLLPSYDIFNEKRYFDSGHSMPLWEFGKMKVGVTICEDIWQHSDELKYCSYTADPVTALAKLKPDIVVNLSSSPYCYNKPNKRARVCQKAAKTLGCPLILCNQVGGNDSILFDGTSLVLNASGEIINQAKSFEEDLLITDCSESKIILQRDPIEEMFNALVMGVRDYFHKQGFEKACFGLSGGIDSAVVACIAESALGKENLLAVMMPSRYSSDASRTDAEKLITHLDIDSKCISIEKPFECYLELIENSEGQTEENLQARIRGMILMALSNRDGYIVLSTGNKSEMAVGYSTLYGDLCGGLGVISDVTKRQVYELANWINRNSEIIPQNIIEKPPSAELRHDQKDSDVLPDYEIIDAVLDAYVEDHVPPEEIAQTYPKEIVDQIVAMIHQSEYKRRQAPPGLRVSEKAFFSGRRFPIVQAFVQ